MIDNHPNKSAIELESITSLLTDSEFLNQLRLQMLKFAYMQLADNGLAEDAVQEALIGAFKNARSFGGKAALKTWVFAILKNKIADTLRNRQRLNETNLIQHQHEEDEDFHELFNENGSWHKDDRPLPWCNPEAAMQQSHFWRVFEACLEHLPGKQARVFMMREFIELDSKEICDTVGITESNLNVMLHRARLRLRVCLDNNWFAREKHHA